MRLQLTVRHGAIADHVRDQVERKLGKLERRLTGDELVEVVLDRERNPKIVADHVVEAEIHVKGANVLAREAAETYEIATDRLVEALERQLARRHEKRVTEPRRRAPGAPESAIPIEEIEQAVRAPGGETA